MTRRILLSGLLMFAAVAGVAQDPIKTLPNNYWVEFENPAFKVIHVRYRPHEKVSRHDHPPTPTVYVYLSDSGPVRFEHAGDDTFDLTRAPLKTGQMRVSPGRLETHRVENLGDLQSDFLRVELKTLPLGLKDMEKRIPAADASFWNLPEPMRIEFEDSHLAVTRYGLHAGENFKFSTGTNKQTLWIAVSFEGATVNGKQAHAGEAWDSSSLTVVASEKRVELIRFDVK